MRNQISGFVDQLQLIRLSLGLIRRFVPRWSIGAFLVALLVGALPAVQLTVTKHMIDAFTRGIQDPDGGHWQTIVVLLVLTSLVMLAIDCTRSLSRIINEQMNAVLTVRIDEEIQRKTNQLDLKSFDTPRCHDLLYRAQQEGSSRPVLLSRSLMSIAESSITLISVAGLLVAYDWRLPLIIAVTSLPQIFVLRRFSNHRYEWEESITEKRRLGAYLHVMLTSENYAKEMRSFNLVDEFIRRYGKVQDTVRTGDMNLSVREEKARMIARISTVGGGFICYWIIALATMAGRATLGAMVMLFQAVQRVNDAMTGLILSLAELYDNCLFVTHYREFMALESTASRPHIANPTTQSLRIDSLQLKGVGFQYPSAPEPTLHGVDLQLKRGETIAIVGENGSGKTTLIKLLCGLYEPDSGQISINGVNRRRFSPEQIRDRTAVMFQDYGRYFMSVRDNIRFGDISRRADHGTVEACAKRAGIAKLIAGMPEGYETLLGKLFDGGTDISIGQWQRIGLARCLYRDADLIIMDEPTSALDPASECRFFELLQALKKDRIVIMVTHRFATVRMADRICVMNEGRIIESGTHAQLSKVNGRYASLYEMHRQLLMEAG